MTANKKADCTIDRVNNITLCHSLYKSSKGNHVLPDACHHPELTSFLTPVSIVVKAYCNRPDRILTTESNFATVDQSSATA
jgi:hypothetical protein